MATGSQLQLAATRIERAAKPLRTTTVARRSLLAVVYSDHGGLDDHARQVIAAATLIADAATEVIVACLGDSNDDFAAYGADRVIVLSDCGAGQFHPEHQVQCLNALLARHRPDHLFFPERCGEADLARRLAAATRLSIATHVVELSRTELAVRDRRSQRLARRSLTRLVLLAPDAVDARLPFVGRAEVSSADAVERGASTYRDLGLTTLSSSSLPLEQARLVIAAGNGVTDFELFRRLADTLDASIGASRVAVDAGHFSRDRQIGATGKTIAAQGYLAIGISGASQHLQGIKGCRHVISINRDAAAAIVQRADLALVDDAQALMQALLDALDASQDRQEHAA